MTATSAGCSARDSLSESEVRAALARVVASESFCGSPQLCRFLHFIVDARLRGQGANIKAYSIGVDAFGRDPSFDPDRDAIVRVEATRLRRALERYYAGAGFDDPVLIGLPRGGYLPSFDRRASAPPAEEVSAGQPGAPPGRRPQALAIVVTVLAVVGAGLLTVLLLPRNGGDPGSRPPEVTANADAGTPVSRLSQGNGMPTVEIASLRVSPASHAGDTLAALLTGRITEAFARFDSINVVSDSAPVNGKAPVPPTGQSRPDYRLSGFMDHGNVTTAVHLRLIDAAETTIVWSRTFERPTGAMEQTLAGDDIARMVANSLLQTYGFIHSRDRARYRHSTDGDPRYRCILEAGDSYRTYDQAGHQRARACLEHLTRLDPGFAVGFEALAVIYNRDYLLGSGVPADELVKLDLALRAAQRAVQLNPASARAYQALMIVLYSRRDTAGAFAAGDKALELNKYDNLILGGYGGRLIMAGNVERGMTMLRRAGDNGQVRQPLHHFFMFLGHYLGGDMQAAAFEAGQITEDGFPLGLVARAIAAFAAGKADQANRAISQLIAVQPGWRTDPRHMLELTIYNPDIVARLLRDLAAAGLGNRSGYRSGAPSGSSAT